MTELIVALGELALASRLKRLSDRLMQDVGRVYRDRGQAFEPRWFLLFLELGRSSPLSVTELAGRIGVTYPAVNQAAAELVRQGLLTAAGDAGDKRRRLLALSERGRAVHDRLQPVWQAIGEATAELLEEAGPTVLAQLGRLEQSLDRRDMRQRVTDRIRCRQSDQVEICGYRPQWKRHFKALNLEWINSYFSVEPRDLAVLNNPERLIIKPGGAVLFARVDGAVVGTCGIVPSGRREFELVKMAVDPAYRGRQIGRKLTQAAIAEAKKRGGRVLVARTSTRLEAANQLYRSLGFEPAGTDRSGDFKRSTIVLKYQLA